MDVWPAEVIRETGVWYPAHISTNIAAGEVYLDPKVASDGRIATMKAATIILAATDIQTYFGSPRVWFATGNVDGDDETWLVRHRPGCGCGTTARREVTGGQLDLLHGIVP